MSVLRSLLIFGVLPVLFPLSQDQLPEGPGKDLVVSVCAQCHGIENIVKPRRTLEEWRRVVVSMDAPLTEKETELVIQYLAMNFGLRASDEEATNNTDKQGTKINVNQATTAELQQELGLTEEEASKLVTHREEKGRFADFDALRKVSGIDFRKIERKKDSLSF
ncbi:MAG: helix-hairpin-helix domain-containing protein [Acidobacteria bacterium]|nr:helix-hairpin-helix domain-containing protein [Acidobacteriota bacterium]